jgi:hypothetical protein
LSVSAYANTAPGYPGISPAPQIDIRDFINVQGPDNTQPVNSVPEGPLIAKSTAVDVAAVDFVDKDTSLNQASIFAAVTVDRPYLHSYQDCNRFDGYTLDDVYTVGVSDLVYGAQKAPQFWYMSMSKQGIVEKAYIFYVYVNESTKTFTVDSFWRPGDITASQIPDHNYIFNIQIWAVSKQDAYNVMHNILTGMSRYDGWQVKYNNTQSMKPSFFISDANITKMSVENLLSIPQTINFSVSIRQTNNKSQEVKFTFKKVIDPGINSVNMPIVANSLDIAVYAQSSDFADTAYVGNGYWLAFNKPGEGITKTDVQQAENDNNSLSQGDFPLGSAGIQGSVPANGWGGLARTLNPNSLPVDISKFDALSFWAKGDGNSYSVQLETEAVRNINSSDFHQFVITPGSDWQHFVIPLSSFKQLGTDPSKIVPFTGTDVISVAWATTKSPITSVGLEIKDASFINAGINLTIGSSQMLVNGETMDIDPGYTTAPVIIDGRTFIPIRAVVEALGGTVSWSVYDQTVAITLNDTTILLVIGKNNATVNGADKALDDPPFISATGRTMIPLRFVAENLGHNVTWDDTSKTIAIQNS